MNKLYVNTGLLSRFLLRQDRLRVSIWLLALTGTTFIIANAFTTLYPTEADRQAIAETMRNPAMTAMVGQGYGLDDYTIGAMMAHQMLLFTAIIVALMNILLVARHLRTDEETGRTELIRSLPTGRLSNVSAAMIVFTGTNVLLALMTGLGLFALQIDSLNIAGSLLYGAALGATGFFFMAVTAVFAQLSDNTRGTIGLSLAVLGIAYIIRAMGDTSNETLSWFSPLGWILGTEVYVNNYWWPILLTIGGAIVLLTLAFYLNGIRDLGAGFLPARPGKSHASTFLKNPIGLTMRLQQTALISWAIAMLLLGISYGSVLGDLESFFHDIEMMQKLLTPVAGFSLTEQFIALLMTIMAMISTIPPLMIMLKLKGEEKRNRLELIFSHSISRPTVMGSYLFVTILSSIIMLALTAIGLWTASTSVMAEPLSLRDTLQYALVYLPAIWVMIGWSVLIIGLAPNFSGLVWGYLGYSFFVVYLGGLLDIPVWMQQLSPFGHIPGLPVDEMDWNAFLLLTFIAIFLMFAGFICYRKRDLHG